MRNRWGIVVVVGLVLGLLVSCGGGPDRLSQKTFFTRVFKAQAKAGSSHVAMSLTAPSGQKFTSHGQMKLGARTEDTAMAMTVDGDVEGLGTVELRLVDRTFYVALGALTQGKFAKIDLTDTSNPIARQYGEIIENIDPARQVRQYEDAITKFDATGEVLKIDGVETQPYKISIDPSKSAQVKQLDQAALPDTITFTLYVGPDDLPRRMISRMPAQNGATTRLQMDYTNWGDKVSIKAPGKANITENSLLNRLGQGATSGAP